jgi:Asp/Glu/hydantoin racemase
MRRCAGRYANTRPYGECEHVRHFGFLAPYGPISVHMPTNIHRLVQVTDKTSSSPPVRVLLVGPTSAPWESIAPVIEMDLTRLARPGVELTYRCTDAGPPEIRTVHDARAAAPFVVQTVIDAAREGFDAVIVDCTADPGVVDARVAVTIPVVGAGEALRSAVAAAKQPVCELTGDDLRGMDVADLVGRIRGASTVALGGTGFSHLVEILAHANPDLVVLDPLSLALDACLAHLSP